MSNTTCCGLKEFSSLKAPTAQLYEIYLKRCEYRFAMALFTDNFVNKRRGQGLAKLIKKLGVGEVIETPLTYNPNSHRNIKAWIYVIDREKLLEWGESRKKSITNNDYPF